MYQHPSFFIAFRKSPSKPVEAYGTKIRATMICRYNKKIPRYFLVFVLVFSLINLMIFVLFL